MARGLWSGAISFGLINIPVQVMSAKDHQRISFRLPVAKAHVAHKVLGTRKKNPKLHSGRTH